VIDRNGGLPSAAGRDVGGGIPRPTTPIILWRLRQQRTTRCSANFPTAEPNPRYALLCDVKGAPDSNTSTVRSRSEASSFSGAFTCLEIGHMVTGSDG
jgi:hypothetical protein